MKKLFLLTAVLFCLVLPTQASLVDDLVLWYAIDQWYATDCFDWDGNNYTDGDHYGYLAIQNDAPCNNTKVQSTKNSTGIWRGYDGELVNMAYGTGDFPNGKLGDSVRFNNGVVNQVVNISNSVNTETFTNHSIWSLTFWIKPETITGNERIIQKGCYATGNINLSHMIWINSGTETLKAWFKNGTHVYAPETTTAIVTGSWYYVGYVSNGTHINLYVNGLLNDTVEINPGFMPNNPVSDQYPLHFGTGLYGGGGACDDYAYAAHAYHGYLDDIRYYSDYGLTNDSINYLYNSGSGRTHAGSMIGDNNYGFNNSLKMWLTFDDELRPNTTYAITPYDSLTVDVSPFYYYYPPWDGYNSSNIKLQDNIYFDGNHYIDLFSDITAYDNMSLSAWIKTNDITGQKTIFSAKTGGTNANSVYFGLNSVGKPYCYAYDSSQDLSQFTSDNILSLNTWYMLTCVIKNNNITVYVDGDNVSGVRNYFGGSMSGLANNQMIGTHTGDLYRWTGYIDEFMIWGRALSSDEAWSLYVGGEMYQWNDTGYNKANWGEQIYSYMVKDITDDSIRDNATIESNYDVWRNSYSGQITNTSNFDIALVNQSNYSLGMFPIYFRQDTNRIYKADGIIEYNDVDYDPRQYYYDDATISLDEDTITTLYLLETIYADPITLNVEDNSGNALEGVIIYVERYDIGEDTYKLVAMAKTSQNGQDLVYLRKDDVWYRFKIYQDGALVFTSDAQKIYDDTLTLTVEESVWGDYQTILEDVNATLYFNNATNNFITSFSSISGNSRTVCMVVKQSRPGGRVNTLNDTCLTSASGSISIDINESYNPNYKYYAVVYTSVNPSSNLLELWVSLKDNVYARNGLLIGIPMIILLVMAGSIAGGAVAILMSLIGLFVISPAVWGLATIGETVIMGIVSVGILLIILMRNKQ